MTGARQRARIGAEWEAYGEAVVLRVDVDTHKVERFLTYVSPSDVCAADKPSIVFKCASRDGNRLVLCTETEVFSLDLDTRAITDYVSIPLFNDVHHAIRAGKNSYVVANTGLDIVMEVGCDGTVQREWSALDGSPKTRLSREIDYRKIPSTKPHRSHPNFVFDLDGELWVTRFIQRDAVSLRTPTRRIELGHAGPHDGIEHDGAVYFTSVDGRVLEVDRAKLEMKRTIDLNASQRRPAPLGWCRGLFVDDGVAWVGFSRLRPTNFRHHLAWLKRPFAPTSSDVRPTRLAAYDLRRNRLLDEIDLEPYDFNAVFSIVAGEP